jgi:hypothetical protein
VLRVLLERKLKTSSKVLPIVQYRPSYRTAGTAPAF